MPCHAYQSIDRLLLPPNGETRRAVDAMRCDSIRWSIRTVCRNDPWMPRRFGRTIHRIESNRIDRASNLRSE